MPRCLPLSVVVAYLDNPAALETLVACYNDAWNRHDLDAIVALHAPGMVFENVSTGERAEGERVRDHIAGIFASWPDLSFSGRRMHVRDGLVVQEWTAQATHLMPVRRGERVLQPTGKRLEWNGLDILPFENRLLTAKIVYSDSLAILRQLGAID
jgi:ketosteroid isomerase-like protein